MASSSKTVAENTSLREMLEEKIPALLPEWEERRMIVAHPTLAEFLQKNQPLSQDIKCTHRPIQSNPVRGRISHGGLEPIMARWPEDKLIATRFPLLICPLEGDADFYLGDYILHLPEGQLCLLLPEVPRDDGTEPHLHGERREGGSCELLWLKCGERGLETWVCHSRGKRHYIGEATRRTTLPCLGARHYFATLEHEAKNHTVESAWICQGLLKVLFGILLRELKKQRGQKLPRRKPSMPGGIDWDPIAFAQEYVRSHLADRLTIKHMARLAYMAESPFMERFRRETGQTFNQFLTSCRLEKAQALLRDSDWEMTAISHEIGVNPSHLRRLFARHAQVSPREFRRQSQNKPRYRKK